MNEKDILPFGKFKGKDIVDCPSSYLKWLLEQEWFENEHTKLYKATKEEYKFRDARDLHFQEGERRRG